MKIIQQKEVSDLATVYLAELRENPNYLVEFVETRDPNIAKAQKWVLMISTQFGCAVGCDFCDVGSLGYQGNLTQEEMLSQIRYLFDKHANFNCSEHPKIKIHFARMGEPSLNPNVLGALERLGSEFACHGIIASISSVAPKTQTVDLFFSKLKLIKNRWFSLGRFQLQFSIHSTDENKRNRLIPIKKWSLEEITRYGEKFVEASDRKVTLNFALSKAEDLDPMRVKNLFSNERFLIKITPINPTGIGKMSGRDGLWFAPPPDIGHQVGVLKKMGFEVIVSPSERIEIDSKISCGQLFSERLSLESQTLIDNRNRQKSAYVTPDNLEKKSLDWLKSLAPFSRRVFEFDESNSALLIVDMQNLFLSPRSAAYLACSQSILPNVLKILEVYRKRFLPVFFTRHSAAEFFKGGDLMGLWWRKRCKPDSWEAEIYPPLTPWEKEGVFLKDRYSAFLRTGLEEALRSLKVKSLVVVGVMTNLCVETTVRDAFMRDFETWVPVDASAAVSEELHLASLKSMAHGFAQILKTSELLSKFSCQKYPSGTLIP